ncbi:hypothetical protein SOVF_024710 [Spinacia oleracea]|nr:hypothetical protein SOVF_024710 [Spinacia oleracea]
MQHQSHPISYSPTVAIHSFCLSTRIAAVDSSLPRSRLWLRLKSGLISSSLTKLE